MTTSNPLNLAGIARKLDVGFHRVRGWRARGAEAADGDGRLTLPEPDVSNMPGHPLWSERCIEQWAEPLGLWPPKGNRQPCTVCEEPHLPLPGGGVRPHWADGARCPGGGRLDRLVSAA